MSDMTRARQVLGLVPTIKTDREKAGALDTALPDLLAGAAGLAGGDAAMGRAVASMAVPVAGYMTAREWAAGMTTQPGDLVLNPAKTYTYMYTGAAAMTHANATFYPGASGVYYWSVIPDKHEGVKVYPNISGIVVAVRRDEIWWNPAKTQQYRWNDATDNSCSWYPGQPGVHQWVAL